MGEQQTPSNDSNRAPSTIIDSNIHERIAEVTNKLSLLIDKMDGQKKRDIWDRFQIVASFISSVLFAGVGLYFTTVYNNREAKRQEDLQHTQLLRAEREEKRDIEMQNVQKEIAQLEAIISLTPLLASKDKDTKNYALITLQALEENKNFPHLGYKNSDTNTFANINSRENENSSKDLVRSNLSLLSRFAQIALAANSTLKDKNDAVKSLRDIAVNPSTPKGVKEKAADYVNKIAVSQTVPDEIRKTAYNYLKEIMDIPILNRDSLIKIDVTFGYMHLGSSIIWVYDSNNELIAQFRDNEESSYELPKLDFGKTKYFKVVIAGTSVDINPTTNRGIVTITFSQGKYVIATKTLSYTFNKDGDTSTFKIEGILHL